MARKKRKPTKPKNDPVAKFLRPTPEREAHNDFRSAGAAVAVVPPIVRLHESGVLSDDEFVALAYYRDQASLADRSPTKSCIDFTPKGGNGPGVAIISAQQETWRMERDMGELVHLVRAIAVDDQTLEQYCIDKFGSTDKGRPKADPDKVGIALLELKYAAGGIVR